MEGFLGIGGTELFIILLFAFLIFGPDKLPGIARTIGRAIAKFRDAQNEVNEVIRQEVYDPATDADNPLQKVSERAAELNKREAPKTESFAERKARYDKIRAERKAKEEAAAKEAAAKAEPDAPVAAAQASAEEDIDVDALLGVAPAAPAAAASTPSPAPAPTSSGDTGSVPEASKGGDA
jgi:TatA/E family protein of Tat protein translocase